MDERVMQIRERLPGHVTMMTEEWNGDLGVAVSRDGRLLAVVRAEPTATADEIAEALCARLEALR